jgi:hypothetical protein
MNRDYCRSGGRRRPAHDPCGQDVLRERSVTKSALVTDRARYTYNQGTAG